jgi:hypothetical protein
MKPLPDESVAKTLFGVMPDLASLFADFKYCRYERSDRGTLPIAPPGYFFVSSEAPGIKIWGDDNLSSCLKHGLYVRPLPDVRRRVESRCTPRIGGASNDYIGSFKIIPWAPYGHALILASDSNMIANPWVAFVPLEALPKIDLTNTEIYAP